jgi:hypothetical protein
VNLASGAAIGSPVLERSAFGHPPTTASEPPSG